VRKISLAKMRELRLKSRLMLTEPVFRKQSYRQHYLDNIYVSDNIPPVKHIATDFFFFIHLIVRLMYVLKLSRRHGFPKSYRNDGRVKLFQSADISEIDSDHNPFGGDEVGLRNFF